MTVTIPEAAEMVGVQPGTVARWVERGHLCPVRPGAKPLRFWREDVRECFDQRRPETWHTALDRLAEHWDLTS